MKSNVLYTYKLTKMELIILWLNNYEFGESLIDITEWVKFKSIDELVDKLVMTKEHNPDEFFYFSLNLDGNEESELRDYLLNRKTFVTSYILKRRSFSPGTHLYQLYLQYLSDQLNEVEKNILLDGYLHMLAELYGDDSIMQKRFSLEKKLNLR